MGRTREKRKYDVDAPTVAAAQDIYHVYRGGSVLCGRRGPDPRLNRLHGLLRVLRQASRRAKVRSALRRHACDAGTHLNLGTHRPSLSCWKNRGTNVWPLSSRRRRSSRCDSSTAVFASVAAIMSFARIASVRSCHRLVSEDAREQAGTGRVGYDGPSGFVWLLLFLRRDPLGRGLVAVLLRVEQDALLSRLQRGNCINIHSPRFGRGAPSCSCTP